MGHSVPFKVACIYLLPPSFFFLHMVDVLAKLINTIYKTGEWPKDFTELTMIALKKKRQATKCSNHRIISLITHTAKIIAKILRRRIERKIEVVLAEDQLEFRRGIKRGMQLGL